MSLTRSDDRSREREFDALYVGTRAVLRANRLRGHGLIGNLSSRRISMTKKISFFVVTVAAVTLVLSGCGKGPGMDDMDMALPYVGTWHLSLPVATTVKLEAAKFTITAGDGNAFIGMEAPYDVITMIVVTGDFKVADAAFTLTVDGVDATFAPGVMPVQQEVLSAGILTELQVG